MKTKSSGTGTARTIVAEAVAILQQRSFRHSESTTDHFGWIPFQLEFISILG